jgi:predicted nucleotidyltransferase component of viral defense system
LKFVHLDTALEGQCKIPTYELDELLGTKLRALYQRKKGRDLFDLAIALEQDGVDPGRIVDTFAAYMEHGGHNITRALFEQNVHLKMADAVHRRYQSAACERIHLGHG